MQLQKSLQNFNTRITIQKMNNVLVGFIHNPYIKKV